MKKTVEVIKQERQITVCDICGSKDICIDWEWSVHCPYDNCFEDWGEANFCSLNCFKEGIEQAKLQLDGKEDFYQQSFTLKMTGQGTSELTDFITKLLSGLQPKSNE